MKRLPNWIPSPGCLAEWRANLPPLRERWIGALAALTVISTLWNVTGMAATPLLVCTILAALTFLAMFFPMSSGAGTLADAKENLRRLVRFPGFWLGILLFALMFCQHMNPSREIVLQEKTWWQIWYIPEHVSWLPDGIAAPFGLDGNRLGMNALRQMCIFGSAWLVLCALWCGVRSRRIRTWLMWALALNAVLIAVFCLLRWSNNLTSEYLGYKTGARSFFGVFSYKNHAAEFFMLSLSLSVSLSLTCWRRSTENFRKSGAHILLAAFSFFLWIAALCTASFAGIVEAAAWLPVVPALILASGLMRRQTWIAFGFVFVMIAGLAAVWFATADMDRTWDKIEAKFSLMKQEELDDRAPLRELSWNMFTRSPARERFGWGAGAYRWVAPSFQRQIPEFLNKKGGLRTWTEYAHCDPLQMLAEWGAVGAGIFFAGTLWFFAFAARNVRRWRVSSVALLCGVVFFIAHSTMDFVSYNPALLLMLAVLVVAFRWSLKGRERAFPPPAPEKFSSFNP